MIVQALEIVLRGIDGNFEPVAIGGKYSYFGAGSEVESILEHKPQGDGDRWNWLVRFKDGHAIRVFQSEKGVVSVDYVEADLEPVQDCNACKGSGIVVDKLETEGRCPDCSGSGSMIDDEGDGGSHIDEERLLTKSRLLARSSGLYC